MALRVKIIATDSLSGTLLRVSKNVMRLGVRFAKMGILAAAAISAIAIKLQSDLDIGIREIGTLMDGLTNKQIKGMTRELETLAQKWGQSMKVLTKTKYDIVSAGFSSAAESALLLEKTAILATAGVTDMATAGDLLTTALNAYGKSAKDAEHFSDVLFQTVKKGKTTIAALGGSFGRILGIGASVGFSFEEMAATLATLTLSLGSTELAVTSINGMIMGLLKPSEELEEILKKTEHASVDAMIAELGMADSLALIKDTADKANVKMKDLFGNIRALMGILPLTTTQQKQYNEILASYVDITGTAERASDEVMKAFEKSMARMKLGVENLLRSLGRELIEKLQPKIDAFNDAMERMGELDWKKLADIITNNWKVILIAVLNFGIVAGKIIGEKLGGAILDGLKAAFPKIVEFFKKGSMTMQEQADAYVKIIEEAIKKGDPDAWLDIIPDEDFWKGATEPIETFGDAWENLKNILTNLIIPAFTGVKKIIEEVNEEIDYSKYAFESWGRESVEKVQTLSDTFKELWENIKKGESDFLTNWAELNSAVENLHSNLLSVGTARIEEEMNKRIAIVLKSGLAEEEKEAKIANIREQYHQKEIAWAKKLKAIKMAQAISNVALGITRAFVDPGGVLGVILAAFIAVAGAAEVATIAAQPYARGGFVRGNIPASDTIPAMLTPNEIVSTSAASERFGAEIQRLNQLAEGGFRGGGGDTYYINAIDSQSFVDMVRRKPNGLAEAMQLVKSERYL